MKYAVLKSLAVVFSMTAGSIGPAVADEMNRRSAERAAATEAEATAGTTASRYHSSNRIFFPGYYRWSKKLLAEHGIDFAILSAPVFQAGTGADTTYADHELDIYLKWQLLDNESTAGHIFFYGIWVQTLSRLPTGAFAQSQGVSTLPNSGGTGPGKSIVIPAALWWEQKFTRSGLRFRVGQLWATNIWTNNEFYGDDRATYMNSIMGGGAGVPWIGGNRGLGAMISLERPWGYVAAGFQDSKADTRKIDFSSFSDGRFSYLAEVKLNTGRLSASKGAYKLTLGYVDSDGTSGPSAQPSGYGVNISGQQRLSENLAVYGLFRKSWNRYAANVEQAAAIGITSLEPFGWANDNASIAAFYSKPADTQSGALREEIGFEAFWRFQLTPQLDITPSLVYYIRPGHVAQQEPVAVIGLRLRFIL